MTGYFITCHYIDVKCIAFHYIHCEYIAFHYIRDFKTIPRTMGHLKYCVSLLMKIEKLRIVLLKQLTNNISDSLPNQFAKINFAITM